MKTDKTSLPQELIDTIMDQAVLISTSRRECCRDFEIMTSKLHPNTLIMRWLEIDIEDIDDPVQYFRYRCFNPDGSPQNCSIHYSNQQEANTFFSGLYSLYHQPFAISHKTRCHVQFKK